MTLHVMFRALHRRPQHRGPRPVKIAAALLASALAATALAAAPVKPAYGETMTTTDHAHDFDFLIGKWKVHHWRLKDRLADSHEWVEFDGTSELWMTMDGHGTIDDNYIGLPSGPYRAVGIRGYRSEER